MKREKRFLIITIAILIVICIAATTVVVALNRESILSSENVGATVGATEEATASTVPTAEVEIDISRISKIACVGDSITYGQGVSPNRLTQSFPAVLQSLSGITTLNFGKSGRTLQNEGDLPYTAEPEYTASLECGADLYIIMLGTNDARAFQWNSDRYEEELREFVKTYQSLPNSPQVVLMQPPKVFTEYDYSNSKISNSVIKNQIYNIVKNVGDELGCKVIDLYSLTENHSDWFTDGVHPNEEGNRIIGEYIYSEIFG